MNMIWHAVYLDHFMIIVLENTCHVLMQSLFPLGLYKRSSVFYSKYKLDMKLCICVGHIYPPDFLYRVFGFVHHQAFRWNAGEIFSSPKLPTIRSAGT